MLSILQRSPQSLSHEIKFWVFYDISGKITKTFQHKLEIKEDKDQRGRRNV